jgi:hypothetical protein
MPRYHAHIIDSSGRPTQATLVLQEKTDLEAIETAEQFANGEHDIELRQDYRLVSIIKKRARIMNQATAAE